MSVSASAWAKRQVTGSAPRKCLLMVLADYATVREDWEPEGSEGRHFTWAGQKRLARETEMAERSIRTHLDALEDAGLIRRVVRPGGGEGRQSDILILAVDDDGRRPFEGNRQDLPEGATGNSEQGNRQNGAGAPYIEPPSQPPPTARDDVQALCELLARRIEENGSRKPTITKQWQDAARLLLDKDGFTESQVAWIIEWSQRDSFWRSNILSMTTLRKQFDRLKLRALEEHNARRPGTAEPGTAARRPKYPSAAERAQERSDQERDILLAAEAYVEEHGGDPEDHKAVFAVAARIKSGELPLAGSTVMPYIEGEIVRHDGATREVTSHASE